MKKFIALVLALAMILSIATSTAFATCGNNNEKATSLVQKVLGFNPLGSIFSKDEEKSPVLSFANILANVKKGVEGTGLVYGRDYKIEVSDDSTYGYRIHLIQPLTGVTLYDNYLLYKDGKWTWEKEWNIPEIPTEISLDAIKTNIYQALWDSGIYVDMDQDVQITRDSQDGFTVLIIDPITGRTIYDKQFIIEDSKTISWKNEFEPIAEDSILAAHFPTTEEAEEEMNDEGEKQVEDVEPIAEEPTTEKEEAKKDVEVKEEETPVVVKEDKEVVIDDETPLADEPAVEPTTEAAAPAQDDIANTGDAAFSAVAAVAVLAGAAFVATSKKHD